MGQSNEQSLKNNEAAKHVAYWRQTDAKDPSAVSVSRIARPQRFTLFGKIFVAVLWINLAMGALWTAGTAGGMFPEEIRQTVARWFAVIVCISLIPCAMFMCCPSSAWLQTVPGNGVRPRHPANQVWLGHRVVHEWDPVDRPQDAVHDVRLRRDLGSGIPEVRERAVEAASGWLRSRARELHLLLPPPSEYAVVVSAVADVLGVPVWEDDLDPHGPLNLLGILLRRLICSQKSILSAAAGEG